MTFWKIFNFLGAGSGERSVSIEAIAVVLSFPVVTWAFVEHSVHAARKPRQRSECRTNSFIYNWVRFSHEWVANVYLLSLIA